MNEKFGRLAKWVTAATVTVALALVPAPAMADEVSVNPTSSGLPAGPMAQKLLDWGGQIGLWGSLGALLAGGTLYGWSQLRGHSANAHRGQTLAIGGSIGALIVGLAPKAINSLYSAAQQS